MWPSPAGCSHHCQRERVGAAAAPTQFPGNHLSLWGYRWGQLWTRKLSVDVLISAVLLRAHAHPHPLLCAAVCLPPSQSIGSESGALIPLCSLVRTLHSTRERTPQVKLWLPFLLPEDSSQPWGGRAGSPRRPHPSLPLRGRWLAWQQLGKTGEPLRRASLRMSRRKRGIWAEGSSRPGKRAVGWRC